MSGVPDQHIHPVATGAAAKTVEKHQEPQDLVFYSGWVSQRIIDDSLKKQAHGGGHLDLISFVHSFNEHGSRSKRRAFPTSMLR